MNPKITLGLAAKTRFSDKDIRKILSKYKVGDLVSKKPFKRGYVQTNILIKTTSKKYVLRYYENRSRKSVEFEVDLLKHLAKNNYPCAHSISQKNGQIIGIFSGKPYILFSYLKGHHLKNLNTKQLSEMVKYMAILHNLSENYKLIHSAEREPRTKQFCLKVATIESKRFIDKSKGSQRLAIIKSRLKKIKLPKNLPKGVIHGDFDKANIKFTGERLSGVLDFDDATHTFFIYDIGVIILYWARFYLNKFDLVRARKIIKTYNNYRPLSTLEKRHLFDAVQFAALMIMSWMMYDKWKGKDLFLILNKILVELENIGRKKFYQLIFKSY